MGDIRASSVTDWNAEGTLSVTVIGKQFSQVVDTIEEGDPAVVMSVMTGNFAWCVVAAQLEGLGKIDCLAFFITGGARKVRSWYSCCHLFCKL